MLPASQWDGYNGWRYNGWWYWNGWYWRHEIAGHRGYQSSVSSRYMHVQQWHCGDGRQLPVQQRRILLELQPRFLPCDYHAGHRVVQTMQNRVLSIVADVDGYLLHEMDRVFSW